MTIASDNVFPKVILDASTDPSAPANDNWKMYAKVDGIYARSSNTIVGPFGSGGAGAVATDAIWDAAGDLAVGTGANTAARLAIGATNGMSLRRVSGAVAWQLPPGHELDFVEFTSDVSISATTEATANTIVTANAVAFDGSTRVKIEYWIEQVVTVSGANLQLWLYDGSSSIGRIGRFLDDSASRMTANGIRFLTPSNASHTYSIRGSTGSGTATAGAGAGGTGNAVPGFIRITIA